MGRAIRAGTAHRRENDGAWERAVAMSGEQRQEVRMRCTGFRSEAGGKEGIGSCSDIETVNRESACVRTCAILQILMVA